IYESSLIDPLEACLLEHPSLLEANDDNSEISEIVNLLNSSQVLEIKEWRQKFEELPPRTNPPIPSSEKPPKLDLK
ncbi:unnamed protein product, partial [Ilex paraguariensis]